MKILILIFFSTEGTTSLHAGEDWMLESIHFTRGPSMYGIHYQLYMA